jgi:hypothetical protein
MHPEKQSVEFQKIKALMEGKIGALAPAEIDHLHFALQSIPKRMEYCKYHKNEFIKYSDRISLLRDRIESPNDEEISIRTIFESNATAFIYNLHALVDSFPYLLNIIFRIKDINSSSIGWGRDHLKGYKNYPFYRNLEEFQKKSLFRILKGITNTSKHKYLIRVKNDYKTLSFEEINYEENTDKKIMRDVPIEKFLLDSYNQLIPELIDLLNIIIEFKITEIEAVNETL